MTKEEYWNKVHRMAEVSRLLTLKLDEEGQQCELKRLYVRPQFRGRKMGEKLLEVILKDAREIGYKAMLLDTLPFLKSAIKMYQKRGFYEIPCYNDSPMDTTIYMKLDL